MIVLPGIRRSAANADGTSASGRTAPTKTEAARQLIGRARDGELVDLAVVSALDLCVLGGLRHPLFDEDVARAWLRMGDPAAYEGRRLGDRVHARPRLAHR